MCGITGIIHPQAEAYIEAFSHAIAHRGPDGLGYYYGPNIALAHRRLAIQDLSKAGAQPMYSKDGRYVMIYNGEIYNHWEVRKEMGDAIPYSSTSDTETLLQGYIQYGPEILKKINGIFSFAIHDSSNGDLFIARDPFGVKPLYYYQDQETFLFSSEMKSFTHYPDLDRAIDFRGIVNYIQFLWSPGSTTALARVKKLEPGHFLRLNVKRPAQIEITKYYEIPFSGKYAAHTEEQLIDELEAKLLQAVRRQLLSDVPVGFFLSGGLDSSLIVAMAKKILGQDQRLKCFTIDAGTSSGKEGFTEDLPYARRVADFLDVDLQVIKGDVDIIRDFDDMIWHLDEPQADIAPLHVSNICRAARQQGYVVLLGGTGGDDLFSGYRRHEALYFERKLKLIPRSLLSIGASILSNFPGGIPTVRRIHKLLSGLSMPSADKRSAQYYSWLPSPVVRSLISTDRQNEIAGHDPTGILLSSLACIPNEKDRLNQMLYWDMKYFLTDHNLNYTDKMGMAHGVEIRVPYLDTDLVAFSTTIPPGLKMKGRLTKYLLRKVAERYLPKEVIYRPKTGFGAPVREWVTGGMSEKIHRAIAEEKTQSNPIFNSSTAEDLVKRNQISRIDASYSVLAMLAIMSWTNQFVRRKKPVALNT